MTKIITDTAQVNNYLRTKTKVSEKKVEQRLQAMSERRSLELEIAMDPEDREFKDKDLTLATAIGNELVHHYPGHGWQVECDIRNGVAKIFNCHMSGLQGYLLHLSKIDVANFRADIMRVGGTLLESFGLDRGKVNENQVIDKQRDHSGSVKADY